MRTMWNIYLTIFFSVVLCFGQSRNRVFIHLPDSSYSAKLTGYSGTNTAGNSVLGAYSTAKSSHYFNITESGWYNLYVDAAGGTNWSLDALWSPRYIDGTDARTTSYLETGTISLNELQRLLTAAAEEWVRNGSASTPWSVDDITMGFNADSTFGIINNYTIQDTLGSDTPDISGSQWFVVVLPDTITGFTGAPASNHPKDVFIEILTSGPFVFDSAICTGGVSLGLDSLDIARCRWSNGSWKVSVDHLHD